LRRLLTLYLFRLDDENVDPNDVISPMTEEMRDVQAAWRWGMSEEERVRRQVLWQRCGKRRGASSYHPYRRQPSGQKVFFGLARKEARIAPSSGRSFLDDPIDSRSGEGSGKSEGTDISSSRAESPVPKSSDEPSRSGSEHLRESGGVLDGSFVLLDTGSVSAAECGGGRVHLGELHPGSC